MAKRACRLLAERLVARHFPDLGPDLRDRVILRLADLLAEQQDDDPLPEPGP